MLHTHFLRVVQDLNPAPVDFSLNAAFKCCTPKDSSVLEHVTFLHIRKKDIIHIQF